VEQYFHASIRQIDEIRQRQQLNDELARFPIHEEDAERE
jgi:hypothetical protein